MDNKAAEWMKQADYDMETAEFMHSGGRYFYAVFLCHLSLEKALKGLYLAKLREVPPKTHNLIYLLDKMGIRPEEKTGTIIARLNEAHIATRYPEDLEQLQSHYTDVISKQLIIQAKEVLQWIKKQF
ncbi:MAG TPA: HEPN domain-containing protein [Anaerohalosphaeraceae bacterium]|nr:HEPN domain-containing protein [Anaerohalosphaeraceae bacterium]HOL90041.1 HEPN domain-containing protein [Anaerohalosphaeraceae bacterium]HPP57380.1 HEPN domain-containing protein [Anaerohalosphaeraceae bacterium]